MLIDTTTEAAMNRVVVTIEKKNGKRSSMIVRQMPHDPVVSVGMRFQGGRVVAVEVMP